ncbi:DUF1684 domain-containing protein [Flavisolibacter ginsengisoli]|uniref:DUF1684 domain-containing protein n=1 Tax=Flavisolibacter ginsengisoli DSM 18119 TaxID=1121884 RepID=A0A1M4WZB0_9BACT|nr:DUF1684 domain-containing protein [Flavisolibacter ginsengisoli]SHE86535.1 hypothetical protein SAMN02745131_01277 [Flavisolibacter ginsengisoli DSM 18119]
MRTILFVVSLCFSCLASTAQHSYKDSIQSFINQYRDTHEVINRDDRKKLSFFPVNEKYRVKAKFEKTTSNSWFLMPTSGTLKKTYRLYGVLHFKIDGAPLQLNVYQSQDLLQSEKYKDYLFLPFTDSTSGYESYHGGRYLDLTFDDIQGNEVVLDFNKAYNPYCAYVTGRYNCPIPPPDNHLHIAVKAGEMSYNKE